jgi:hypothetical protein
MRKLLQSGVLLLAFATPLFAASASEFYTTLLRRGVSDVEAGRNADATMSLRLAAFGLVDSIEHYQIAQAYLAVAHDRLGNGAQVRDAATRILAAERIEKKFRSIALPAAIRTAFEGATRKVVSAAEFEALRGGATAKASDPVVVDRVEVVTEQKPAATPPPPSRQAPVKTPTPAPTPQPQTPSTQPPSTQAPTTPPQSPQTSTSTVPAKPVVPKPVPPQPVKSQPPVGKAAPQRSAADAQSMFAAADRALVTGNINEGRRLYREIFAVPGLDHATMVRVAEGLYRSRDFANVLAAFDRAGALRSGEEPYRYYIAVAAFEVGQFDRARRELTAVLPFIELTPDVQRYRAQIEAAR